MKINLNVFGQNVVISGEFGKLTKRIIDKEERISFVNGVKAYIATLDSKLSEGKKKIAEQSVMSLFNKETEKKKVSDKIESKKEKNKEVAEIKEIVTKKVNVKEKKNKIEKSLTEVVSEVSAGDRFVTRRELEELLNKENSEKNTSEPETRYGRESGRKW